MKDPIKERIKALKKHRVSVTRKPLDMKHYTAIAQQTELREIDHEIFLLKANPHGSRFFEYIPAHEYKDYLREQREKKKIAA
jgi:hypothetical protein